MDWIRDGCILMAFILGLPANEIVIPFLLMAYLSSGTMVEFDSISTLSNILKDNGWTLLTGLNVMLFSLMSLALFDHINDDQKETGSYKWATLAFIIPTLIGIALCFVTTVIFHLFGWA